MYELISGRQPFTCRSFGETLNRIVHKPFPALQRNIPRVDEIERILAIALAKDPTYRYPDATDPRWRWGQSRHPRLPADFEVRATRLLFRAGLALISG
jgi:hypothetical protein